MIKKLFSYVRGYWHTTILTPLTVAAEVVLEVFIPLFMADIIDIGIPNKDLPYVLRTGGLMVLMAMGALLFGALGARFAVYSSNGAAKNLRLALFARVQAFSAKNIDKFSTASLVTRLTNDITNIQQSFQIMIRLMARSPLMLVLATLMAVRISGKLSVIMLASIPFLGITMAVVSRLAYPLFNDMLKKYDQMNADAQENLIAIRVVKAFVREDYEIDKFERSAAAVKKAQKRAETLLVITSPLMQITMYTCIIAVIWLGGGHVIDGQLAAGDLMSFIAYISQILMALMMITMAFVNFVLSSASAKRIYEVLTEDPVITDGPADADVKPADGSIEFRDVCFSYSDNPSNLTLAHINLSIRSGEVIGIIGGSGSAKTTLVQLIPRLYDVLSGQVLVGGRDVRDYKIESLRGDVGMVLQKNVLFSGTIRDNLRWGNQNATDAQIEAACRAAAAHDFIMSFPDGYDTVLGQGGVNVSGGQKQRLCIARALLKSPKILILDDSTSAVDTATDAAIRHAFRTQLADTTKLIIAQRITSVMDADRIIVMHDGQIDAVGTHDELLATNQIYQEVYHSQQKGVA